MLVTTYLPTTKETKSAHETSRVAGTYPGDFLSEWLSKVFMSGLWPRTRRKSFLLRPAPAWCEDKPYPRGRRHIGPFFHSSPEALVWT